MVRSRIWLAASISLISSSAEPSIGFSFFFNCSALRPWTFRSCSRSLMVSGSWLSSCRAWDKASSTCLSSANRDSLFADRSDIFCFSVSPEDLKMPFCCSSLSSCASHRLGASLSSSLQKAESEQLYRRGAEKPSGTAADDSPNVRHGRGFLRHRLGTGL